MDEHRNPELPDAWIDALKADADRVDGPSPATDAAVLAHARRRALSPERDTMSTHVDTQRRDRQPLRTPRPVVHRRPWLAAGVAAAAVVAALALWPERVERAVAPTGIDVVTDAPTGTPARAAALPHDFNDDGTIDVRDAYLLARGIAKGAPPRAADVDENGTVDQADVERMMQAIVRLEGGAS